jgi:hypothetical protein
VYSSRPYLLVFEQIKSNSTPTTPLSHLPHSLPFPLCLYPPNDALNSEEAPLHATFPTRNRRAIRRTVSFETKLNICVFSEYFDYQIDPLDVTGEPVRRVVGNVDRVVHGTVCDQRLTTTTIKYCTELFFFFFFYQHGTEYFFPRDCVGVLDVAKHSGTHEKALLYSPRPSGASGNQRRLFAIKL